MRRYAAQKSRPAEGRRTLAEITSERIRGDIIAGTFKPGERLMMEALSERYGISMSPLREALAGLAAEQFIVFEGHRGYQVGAMSVEDLHDLTETRKLLEADIVRLALRHGDEVWEGKVIGAYHLLAHTEEEIITTRRRDDTEWEVRNAAFHDAISEACPLRWLKSLRGQTFLQAQRYRYLAWSVLPDPAAIAAEHLEILEAAIARDESRLISAMNTHIDNVALYARELMPSPHGATKLR
jgi:GntR family carbon starvation induced transcriptional regulator